MKILLTGVAGFIGMHVAKALLARGDVVIGVDNLNAYYSIELKKSRLDVILNEKEFEFIEIDIASQAEMSSLFEAHIFDAVINLAAQAGVRYSIENPYAYMESNILGFLNVLECCRHKKINSLVYASSSSVYGGNTKVPFSEKDSVDRPVSFYAATKKANELMANSYSSMYGINMLGLRFFTVYGPWGRPDMAPYLFTKSITEGQPIKVFNYGQMKRDFTYIDDVVNGVVSALDLLVAKACDRTCNFHEVINIGNSHPVELGYFISLIESATGKKAIKEMLPMQVGDVRMTYADMEKASNLLNMHSKTSVEEGVSRFVAWYQDYHCMAKAEA